MIALNLNPKNWRNKECFFFIKKTETECQEMFGISAGEYAILIHINVDNAQRTYISMEPIEVINKMHTNPCTLQTFQYELNKFMRLTMPGIKGTLKLT